MDSKIIAFDKDLKMEILSIFDKTVDDEGYIVEKSNPKQRVLTTEGEEVELTEFAGIGSGSMIFIKSDFISLMKLADSLK